MSKQYTQEDYDNAAIWYEVSKHSNVPRQIRVFSETEKTVQVIFKSWSDEYQVERRSKESWCKLFKTKKEAYGHLVQREKNNVERLKSELAKAEADLEVLLETAAQEYEK
jgi:predicted translin family RNA/ssDNA-binding protein